MNKDKLDRLNFEIEDLNRELAIANYKISGAKPQKPWAYATFAVLLLSALLFFKPTLSGFATQTNELTFNTNVIPDNAKVVLDINGQLYEKIVKDILVNLPTERAVFAEESVDAYLTVLSVQPAEFGVPKGEYDVVATLNYKNNVIERFTKHIVVSERDVSSAAKKNMQREEIKQVMQKEKEQNISAGFDPIIEKDKITRKIKTEFASVDRVEKKTIDGKDSFDVDISENGKEFVKFKDIENTNDISEIKKINLRGKKTKIGDVDAGISTEAIYVNSFKISSAEVTLAKSADVNVILYCPNFDSITDECASWEQTDIPFTDNGDSITFSVSHFTSYAGGFVNLSSYGNTLSLSYELNPLLDQGLGVLYHLNNDSRYGENSAKVYDFSGNGNNGTISGILPVVSGKINNSLYFDGTSSNYVQFGTVPALNGANPNFTISFWINMSKTISGNQMSVFAYNSDAGLHGATDFYVWFGNPNTLYVSGFGYTETSQGFMNLNDSAWHHIVIMKNNTLMTLYLDGVVNSTKTVGNSNYYSESFTLAIGRPYNIAALRGSMDEFSIWNKSLSASEVLDLYNSATMLFNKSYFSQPINANQTVIWDKIYYANTTPLGTNLTYQISTRNDSVWTDFMGPDRTNTSFYTYSGEQLNASNSQYFKYEFYLSTNDSTLTPSVSNISVKYNYPSIVNSSNISTTTQLKVWDESDTGVYGNLVTFYANYSNFTNGLSINGTGIYCNFTENSSGVWSANENMPFNETTLLYTYSKYINNPAWFKVECDGTSSGYDYLNVTDQIVNSINTTCDQGNELTKCNLSGVKNIDVNNYQARFANLTLKSGAIINASSANVILNITGDLTVESGAKIQGNVSIIYANNYLNLSGVINTTKPLNLTLTNYTINGTLILGQGSVISLSNNLVVESNQTITATTISAKNITANGKIIMLGSDINAENLFVNDVVSSGNVNVTGLINITSTGLLNATNISAGNITSSGTIVMNNVSMIKSYDLNLTNNATIYFNYASPDTLTINLTNNFYIDSNTNIISNVGFSALGGNITLYSQNSNIFGNITLAGGGCLGGTYCALGSGSLFVNSINISLIGKISTVPDYSSSNYYGGRGGNIILNATDSFYSSGKIYANGGSVSRVYPGLGGTIKVISDKITNTGIISSNGGKIIEDTGSINLITGGTINIIGTTLNLSGSISSNGSTIESNGGCLLGSYIAGQGGSINITATDLNLNAHIGVVGGFAGVTTSCSGGMFGGGGGSITINSTNLIIFSSTLQADGGVAQSHNGDIGGNGGKIIIISENLNVSLSNFSSNGGNAYGNTGTLMGGAGGQIILFSNSTHPTLNGNFKSLGGSSSINGNPGIINLTLPNFNQSSQTIYTNNPVFNPAPWLYPDYHNCTIGYDNNETVYGIQCNLNGNFNFNNPLITSGSIVYFNGTINSNSLTVTNATLNSTRTSLINSANFTMNKTAYLYSVNLTMNLSGDANIKETSLMNLNGTLIARNIYISNATLNALSTTRINSGNLTLNESGTIFFNQTRPNILTINLSEDFTADNSSWIYSYVPISQSGGNISIIAKNIIFGNIYASGAVCSGNGCTSGAIGALKLEGDTITINKGINLVSTYCSYSGSPGGSCTPGVGGTLILNATKILIKEGINVSGSNYIATNRVDELKLGGGGDVFIYSNETAVIGGIFTNGGHYFQTKSTDASGNYIYAGVGGNIDIKSEYFNISGNLDSSGGNLSEKNEYDTYAGAGGNINITSTQSNLFGNVLSKGGSIDQCTPGGYGLGSNGGNAGRITINSTTINFNFSSKIIAFGGNVPTGSNQCRAGNGGQIIMYLINASLPSQGEINSSYGISNTNGTKGTTNITKKTCSIPNLRTETQNSFFNFNYTDSCSINPNLIFNQEKYYEGDLLKINGTWQFNDGVNASNYTTNIFLNDVLKHSLMTRSDGTFNATIAGINSTLPLGPNNISVNITTYAIANTTTSTFNFWSYTKTAFSLPFSIIYDSLARYNISALFLRTDSAINSTTINSFTAGTLNQVDVS